MPNKFGLKSIFTLGGSYRAEKETNRLNQDAATAERELNEQNITTRRRKKKVKRRTQALAAQRRGRSKAKRRATLLAAEPQLGEQLGAITLLGS